MLLVFLRCVGSNVLFDCVVCFFVNWCLLWCVLCVVCCVLVVVACLLCVVCCSLCVVCRRLWVVGRCRYRFVV